MGWKMGEVVRYLEGGYPVRSFSDGKDRVVMRRGEEPEGMTFDDWTARYRSLYPETAKSIEFYEYAREHRPSHPEQRQ